jgi:signal transduction histidine kinase
MSNDGANQLRVAALEKRCAELQRQLDNMRTEQTNYLQNVSHQLVAPLNAIKWHIENLTAGRLTNVERAKKVLRSVYSQSTIAVHLAKNFALMSNLEADHALTALKEPLQDVSLCRLAINLADDFQPLGWDRNIQIRVVDSGFESAPDVLAMKPLISQVFSNIIENGVKYADSDSEVRIEGSYDQRRDVVNVDFISRGIPLPADTRQLFKRGFRSDQAKNKYPAGTGFGLYIANRIVEMHEGSIAARMTDRGQAVFTVSLTVSGLAGKARFRDPKDRASRR